MKILSLFDGEYEVHEDGRVFSNKRKNKIELVGKVSREGYQMLMFTVSGKRHYINAHRIVAKAFIPNPDNKREVNHIDGNKLNNHVDNLEWVTTRENQLHARDNGLCGKCKINRDIAEEIRAEYATGKYTQRQLAKMYGLGSTNVGYIIKRRRWA